MGGKKEIFEWTKEFFFLEEGFGLLYDCENSNMGLIWLGAQSGHGNFTCAGCETSLSIWRVLE